MFLTMTHSLAELNQKLIKQQQNQLFGHKTYELREQAKHIEIFSLLFRRYK